MRIASASPLSIAAIVFVLVFANAFLVSSAAVAMDSVRDRGDREFVINFGKDGDLLEQMIEMDADGIAGMRAEFAEARAEIRDAIAEIAEARDDASGVPGARVVLKIAFATARSAASKAIDEALAEARAEILRAERELATVDVSLAERTETGGALSVLRTELDALEVALEELIVALRA